MLELIIQALTIGIVGYIFTNDLMQYGNIMHWYANLIDKIPNEYIKKPLGGCSICFTGQLALWIGLLYFRMDAIELIFLISIAIFTVKTIEEKWN